MKRVEITRGIVGICHMQVCVEADASDEEILAVCNAENPSGTSLGWTTVYRKPSSEDSLLKDSGPVTCAGDSKRLHILVAC